MDTFKSLFFDPFSITVSFLHLLIYCAIICVVASMICHLVDWCWGCRDRFHSEFDEELE